MVNDGLTLPLEIRDHDGDLVGIALMNAKSANKSRERGELWTVVPPGDRVLPIEGASFQVLDLVDGHRYRAVLTAGASEQAVKAAFLDRFSNLTNQDLPSPSQEFSGRQPTLERVRDVIAQRRHDLPEGSYTTLLFNKGEDKIRKKTGEEAIELLLARDPNEIVLESADLIYHWLVLLEVTGVELSSVLAELDKRLKG